MIILSKGELLLSLKALSLHGVTSYFCTVTAEAGAKWSTDRMANAETLTEWLILKILCQAETSPVSLTDYWS